MWCKWLKSADKKKAIKLGGVFNVVLSLVSMFGGLYLHSALLVLSGAFCLICAGYMLQRD